MSAKATTADRSVTCEPRPSSEHGVVPDASSADKQRIARAQVDFLKLLAREIAQQLHQNHGASDKDS